MIDLPPLTFNAILIDPPWAIRMRSPRGYHKSPQRHYSVLSFEEIRALPVAHLAQKNCLLWCWATWPLLDACIETVKAWGFAYKSGGAWTKRTRTGKLTFGGGYIVRSACEPYLLATIGSPRYLSKSVRNCIDALRREHSRKPDEQYEMIERLIEPPWCEIFSRTSRPGWSAWGNEVGKFSAPENASARLVTGPTAERRERA